MRTESSPEWREVHSRLLSQEPQILYQQSQTISYLSCLRDLSLITSGFHKPDPDFRPEFKTNLAICSLCWVLSTILLTN
jgi:hypothetical protein